MYLVCAVILLILILILVLISREGLEARKSITHGVANKYWILREKRNFVRFQENMKIRYNRIGSGPTSQDNTKMQNISNSGLCISTYEKLKEKDNLEIEVEVPDFLKPVKLMGSVVWVKELGSFDEQGRRIFYTGIRFGKIRSESKIILMAHLNTMKRP
ncbi:MAG: PilZ domain-containing protein [Candidatus Omnitrophica bacterium]|nr:PilZ domain-containing protein [Candidatus Omnitrophota bacterium]